MIRKYFALSSRERNGFYALCLILLILFGADHYYRRSYEPPTIDYSALEDSVDLFYASKHEEKHKKKVKLSNTIEHKSSRKGFKELERERSIANKPQVKIEINTATFEQLMSVRGIGDFYAKQILDLRERYGGFRSFDPLLSLYGMNEEKLSIMIPQLTIDTLQLLPKIMINSADTLAFAKILALSCYDAKRIVKYRDRLGGFYSLEQLKEVYGIDENQYQEMLWRVALDTISLRKLDINNADFKTVMRHPYINSYENTKAIFKYLHYGPIENWKSFRKIPNLEISNWEGIKHYLKFEPVRPKPKA